MVWQQRSGYYSVKGATFNKRSYDSKFEAGYGAYLESEVQKGTILSFETHKTLDLISNGYKVGTYAIDFVVHHLDKTLEYVETKGWATDVWKLKWKIFCSMYEDEPGIKITLVKQKSFGMRGIRKL